MTMSTASVAFAASSSTRSLYAAGLRARVMSGSCPSSSVSLEPVIAVDHFTGLPRASPVRSPLLTLACRTGFEPTIPLVRSPEASTCRPMTSRRCQT